MTSQHSILFHSWIANGWRGIRFGALATLLLGAGVAEGAAVARSDGGEENSTVTSEPYDNPTHSLGSWIWTSNTFDRQACQLWRVFEIPVSTQVARARLRMTADNEFTLFLDGRELGRGAEWREIYDFNLTPLIGPGRHVLAVKVVNSFSLAGMILGLRVELADGQALEIKSDSTWRIAPEGTKGWETRTTAPADWPAATEVGTLGIGPRWSVPHNVNVIPTLLPIKVYFWQTGWFQITLLVLFGLISLFSIRLLAQLALHKKERLLLQRERARIARDIHDDLGARMTQLVLHGEVVQSELSPESSLRPQLDLVCREAREMLSTLDEILWAVNPRRDTLTDFSSYVCGYAEVFLKPTSIQCFFDVDSELSGVVLDLPVRRALLMVIKETLNNAVKYSGATELLIQIQCHGRKLEVVVQDNGKGFDPWAAQSGRHGLTNMTQRLSELGGTCVVTSSPGKGCRIEFALALKPARQRPFGWLWKRKPFPALSSNAKNPPAGSEVAPSNDPATY